MSKTIDIAKLVSDKDIEKAIKKIKKRQYELQEIRNKEFYNTVLSSLCKKFELLKNLRLKKREFALPTLERMEGYELFFTLEETEWKFIITMRDRNAEVKVRMLKDEYGDYTIKSSASNVSSISFYNTTLSGLPEIIYNFAVHVSRNFTYEMKNIPQENSGYSEVIENNFELFG